MLSIFIIDRKKSEVLSIFKAIEKSSQIKN